MLSVQDIDVAAPIAFSRPYAQPLARIASDSEADSRKVGKVSIRSAGKIGGLALLKR